MLVAFGGVKNHSLSIFELFLEFQYFIIDYYSVTIISQHPAQPISALTPSV